MKNENWFGYEKQEDGSLISYTNFEVDGKKVESCIVDLDGDFKTDSDADKEAIWDGYFHESELRSAPSFTLRIDGITELNAEG